MALLHNMIRNIIALLFIIVSTLPVSAQYTYELELNQAYDTLSTYTSISKIAIAQGQGPSGFEIEIDLGFSFPFFDTAATKLTITTEGIYFMNDGTDRAIYLYSGRYLTDLRIDYSNEWLSSEIRLGRSETSRGKAIHIEYHNVFNEDELLLNNNYDHSFIFTHSFYEDGSCAVSFGESNINNIQYFRDGVGWISDLDPNEEAYGPFLGMEGIPSKNEAFLVYGPLAELTTTMNFLDTVGTIVNYPDKGTILRISRDSSSSSRETFSSFNNSNFKIEKDNNQYTVKCPNCTSHYSVSLHTISGSLICKSKNNKINLDVHPRGIYILRITGQNTPYSILINR